MAETSSNICECRMGTVSILPGGGDGTTIRFQPRIGKDEHRMKIRSAP